MADRVPLIYISGSAPGLPLSFVVAGDMANQFQESYGVDITAKDRPAEALSQPGQSPHPPDMNFDKGAFDNVSFTIQLFSGCLVNGAAKNSGRELVEVSQILFRLSMPQFDQAGSTFVGPPLIKLQYGSFWSAKGFFQKVTFIAQGAWDREAYPTVMTLQIEFARHFGGGPGTALGAYQRAETRDLRAATAQSFAFRG